MSPQSFNPTPLPAKSSTTAKQPSLLEKVDACRNGDIGEHDGLVVPGEDKAGASGRTGDTQMLSAHKIWYVFIHCSLICVMHAKHGTGLSFNHAPSSSLASLISTVSARNSRRKQLVLRRDCKSLRML